MTIQTSRTNPLRIAEVPFGTAGGLIGITFAPGKQQDGMTAEHRRDLEADLDVIAAWNAAVVVTLVEAHELDALQIAGLGAAVRRRHMEWHHWPIGDYQVPDRAFMAAWPGRSALLRGVLARSGRVLVHCKGGLGRAGSVAARLLVEDGMPARAAIAAVRAVGPGAIETGPQEAWVAAGRPALLPEPDRGRIAAGYRATGALLGLAVGDALGAAIEFEPKPRFARLDDMQAGGPHGLAHEGRRHDEQRQRHERRGVDPVHDHLRDADQRFARHHEQHGATQAEHEEDRGPGRKQSEEQQ